MCFGTYDKLLVYPLGEFPSALPSPADDIRCPSYSPLSEIHILRWFSLTKRQAGQHICRMVQEKVMASPKCLEDFSRLNLPKLGCIRTKTGGEVRGGHGLCKTDAWVIQRQDCIFVLGCTVFQYFPNLATAFVTKPNVRIQIIDLSFDGDSEMFDGIPKTLLGFFFYVGATVLSGKMKIYKVWYNALQWGRKHHSRI